MKNFSLTAYCLSFVFHCLADLKSFTLLDNGSIKICHKLLKCQKSGPGFSIFPLFLVKARFQGKSLKIVHLQLLINMTEYEYDSHHVFISILRDSR